jgi:hypothetical protein
MCSLIGKNCSKSSALHLEKGQNFSSPGAEYLLFPPWSTDGKETKYPLISNTFFFFCSTGFWTQGLHFEPLHLS